MKPADKQANDRQAAVVVHGLGVVTGCSGEALDKNHAEILHSLLAVNRTRHPRVRAADVDMPSCRLVKVSAKVSGAGDDEGFWASVAALQEGVSLTGGKLLPTILADRGMTVFADANGFVFTSPGNPRTGLARGNFLTGPEKSGDADAPVTAESRRFFIAQKEMSKCTVPGRGWSVNGFVKVGSDVDDDGLVEATSLDGGRRFEAVVNSQGVVAPLARRDEDFAVECLSGPVLSIGELVLPPDPSTLTGASGRYPPPDERGSVHFVVKPEWRRIVLRIVARINASTLLNPPPLDFADDGDERPVIAGVSVPDGIWVRIPEQYRSVRGQYIDNVMGTTVPLTPPALVELFPEEKRLRVSGEFTPTSGVIPIGDVLVSLHDDGDGFDVEGLAWTLWALGFSWEDAAALLRHAVADTMNNEQ